MPDRPAADRDAPASLIPRPLEWDFNARFLAIKVAQKYLHQQGFERLTALEIDEALDQLVLAYNAALSDAALAEGSDVLPTQLRDAWVRPFVEWPGISELMQALGRVASPTATEPDAPAAPVQREH